jgi:hypothetical protein
VDCALITGRSTSYLITNEDGLPFDLFQKPKQRRNTHFDFIDANRFIPFTKENEIIIQKQSMKK